MYVVKCIYVRASKCMCKDSEGKRSLASETSTIDNINTPYGCETFPDFNQCGIDNLYYVHGIGNGSCAP